MILRLAISAPLPWLTMLAGRILKGGGKGGRRRGMKFQRSLSVTIEGKWFIGILLLIGIAAINTGNNLLYLVVATLLSLIIISGILSEATLRGLKVERRLPQTVFKGSPARASFRFTNTKKRFPSYSFIASDNYPSTNAYVLKLGPSETADAPVEYTFRKRGLARLSGVRVATRFPFGLFTKGKEEPAIDEVLVLPSVAGSAGLPGADAVGAHGDFSGGGSKGSGPGLYGLREYTLSDDARHIHWKSAARAQRLLTKEFESESLVKIVVVFENRGPVDELFEELVDRAAALVNSYIEKGYSVGLRTLSSEIAPSPGRGQLLRLLSELALINPENEDGQPSVKAVSS